jgi:hypothetical protein
MTAARIAEREHAPDAFRVRSRCRVACSCGWPGRLTATFGEGWQAWLAHHNETTGAHDETSVA